MKKLLMIYGFNTETEYYEMVVESVINGQALQAKKQFLALPKQCRKNMVNHLIFGCRLPEISPQDKNMFLQLI